MNINLEYDLIFNYLKVCGKTFRRLEEHLNEIGLYRGQPVLLMILYKNDGITQKQIGEKLLIAPATITKMTNRLEKAGFVVKKNDESDLRVTRIYLTDKAYAIRPKLMKVYSDFQQYCFNGLTDEEKVILKKILTKINNNLK